MTDKFKYYYETEDNIEYIIPSKEDLLTGQPKYWKKEYTGFYHPPYSFGIDKITLTVPPFLINSKVFSNIKKMKYINTHLLRNKFGHITFHEEILNPNSTIKESIWPSLQHLFIKGAFRFPKTLIVSFIPDFTGELRDEDIFKLFLILMKNIRFTGFEVYIDVPTENINLDFIRKECDLREVSPGIREGDHSFTLYSDRYKGNRRSLFVIYDRTANLEKKDPSKLIIFGGNTQKVRFEARLIQNQIESFLSDNGYLIDIHNFDFSTIYVSFWMLQQYQFFLFSGLHKLMYYMKQSLRGPLPSDRTGIAREEYNPENIWKDVKYNKDLNWFLNVFEMNWKKAKSRMQDPSSIFI